MSTSNGPRFQTPAGVIIGRRDGAMVRATGIRYARAARFQAPVPEPDTAAPMEATTSGPACPQVVDSILGQALGPVLAGVTYSEDCLRLSVTLPADVVPAEQLPVLFWIHGGSYVSGAGDLAFYDPVHLVTEQRIIVVAVTYRLGLFGFLGTANGPANLGLLDLLAALRWVQRNIAAFGGHPGNVTLLGHSSGGDAAAHLMIAEGAQGLFQRVILHSAPLGLARNRSAMTRAMAAAVAPLAASVSTDEVLAREPRAWAAARRFGLKSGMPFGTQYGAFPLPTEAQAEAAWRAVAKDVDVLIGDTAEELRFFAVIDPKFNWLLRVPGLGAPIIRLLVKAGSHRIYSGPATTFARRHARAGGRAYRFTFIYRAPGSVFGAAHTMDLPMLFGTQQTWAGVPLLGQAKWADVEAAGRRVRQLWADFARTGVLPSRMLIPEVLAVHQV
ncbi:carboxylesterase/lipase family protein [Hymenobacter lutimineralis]|uniref:Carboxylic ester hydrolase n=1 Tax=Hymenobacter lutimineralis TaxID=2606448 RepID=A0A5D6V581_9BACT|nr:carboxylesterase family protein [Hymenobacter lutimineralis]TYZ10993.1 carboxylesterase/lipase family protein [Hymenobacter lutimineralis]